MWVRVAWPAQRSLYRGPPETPPPAEAWVCAAPAAGAPGPSSAQPFVPSMVLHRTSAKYSRAHQGATLRDTGGLVATGRDGVLDVLAVDGRDFQVGGVRAFGTGELALELLSHLCSHSRRARHVGRLESGV